MNLFSAELERDLEIERRRVRELQEASRDRDKEYAKLKASHSLGHINDVANGIQRLQGQFDKVRKRALFGPLNDQGAITPAQVNDDPRTKLRQAAGNVAANVNISAVVGGMEANGVNIQRTPLVPRTQGRAFIPNPTTANDWTHSVARPMPDNSRNTSHRQSLGNFAGDRSFMSSNISDRSASANEVEQLLMNQPVPRTSNGSGWQATNAPQSSRTAHRVFMKQSSHLQQVINDRREVLDQHSRDRLRIIH
ncbi:hypothetical protein CVT26_000881 [Gymnopilus dilepis]|uniref:Uncharacterized protein n=1 Tax=Gymnopilus dilepis TaxID=231916 RepID=A0A409YLC9_9AGAR|nr:hypothetical protein CVT26_000881 [Gymnopilus dilepis]